MENRIFTREELRERLEDYIAGLTSTLLMPDENMDYENPILTISFNASIEDFTSHDEMIRKKYNVNLNFKPTK